MRRLLRLLHPLAFALAFGWSIPLAQPQSYTVIYDSVPAPVFGVPFTGQLQISAPVLISATSDTVAAWVQTYTILPGLASYLPGSTISYVSGGTVTGNGYCLATDASLTGYLTPASALVVVSSGVLGGVLSIGPAFAQSSAGTGYAVAPTTWTLSVPTSGGASTCSGSILTSGGAVAGIVNVPIVESPAGTQYIFKFTSSVSSGPRVGWVEYCQIGSTSPSRLSTYCNLNGAPQIFLADPGSNGLVVRTALNTSIADSLVSASTPILSIANGNGVAGNPTLTLIETGTSMQAAVVTAPSGSHTGCGQYDVNGNLTGTGTACGTGSGSGTVSGPVSTTVGYAATWNDTIGALLGQSPVGTMGALSTIPITTGAATTLDPSWIPSLPASQITSGTLDLSRIPTIPYSQTSGITPSAIGAVSTTGTYASPPWLTAVAWSILTSVPSTFLPINTGDWAGTWLSHAPSYFQTALTNYSTISGLMGYPSTFPPTNSGDWAGTWQSHASSYFQTSISGAPGTWPSFGTAALANTGTSGAVIPLLNGVNTWSGAQTFSAGLSGTLAGHASLDLPLAGGTLTGGLLFTDNTYDIGASGATRPRTGYFGTSLVAPLFNAATGFQISGAAPTGHYPRGNGTDYVDSAIQAGDLPLASASVFGAVEVDGITITATAGRISAVGGGAGTVTGPGSTIVGYAATWNNTTGSLLAQLPISATSTPNALLETNGAGLVSPTLISGWNGVTTASLATGLLCNTTTTGVPSICVDGVTYVSPTELDSGSLPGSFSSVANAGSETVAGSIVVVGNVTANGNGFGPGQTHYKSASGSIDQVWGMSSAATASYATALPAAAPTDLGQVMAAGNPTLTSYPTFWVGLSGISGSLLQSQMPPFNRSTFTRTFESKASDLLSLSDFGPLDCTGVADNSSVFQAAVTFLADPGTYQIRIPDYCQIQMTTAPSLGTRTILWYLPNGAVVTGAALPGQTTSEVIGGRLTLSGTSTTIAAPSAGPYVLPTAASTLLAVNGNASGLSNLPINLTTIGSSGAATYTQSTNTFNVPQYAGGGSMTYPPGTGIPVVTGGVSWGATDTTTGSGTVVALASGPTFTTSATFSSAPITISGNISSTAWLGNGIRIKEAPVTLTDTSSSGPVAAEFTNVYGGDTIAASSATTVTNYYTNYSHAEVAGTNVTLTNSWALGGDNLHIGTTKPLTVTAAGLVSNLGGETIQSGSTLTIANGGTLTCLTGSTCPPVGATMASQLGDLEVTLTAANVLTIGANCSASTPCNVNGYSITTVATATLSGTAIGQAFIYVSAGTVIVGHNLTVSCSNCTQTPGVTAFPANVVDVWTWQASTGTANAWNATGGADNRSFLSNMALTSGTGIIVTPTGAFSASIALDTAALPSIARIYGGSADPGCTTTGDIPKWWSDTATTTTVVKTCKSVVGTVGWSVVTTTP